MGTRFSIFMFQLGLKYRPRKNQRREESSLEKYGYYLNKAKGETECTRLELLSMRVSGIAILLA